MRILFVIEQPEIFDLIENNNYVNPGVGGTTYTSLRLAELLNKSESINGFERNIYLGIYRGDSGYFKDMPIIDLKKSKEKWDIAIITGGTIDLIFSKKLSINAKRKIAWIRHPYDWDKINKAKQIKAEILSVGKAQFLTNFYIAGNHHRINNIFCSSRIRNSAKIDISKLANGNWKTKNKIKIGFMGALVYSKGFHLIAAEWNKIKKIIQSYGREAELHVIGGSSLYGIKESHKKIPCEEKYGELIFKYLGEEIEKDIYFYGKLGKERYKIMRDIDIAIANPLAHGEAFPATLLEWISLGVPTIAPQSYGFGDVMYYFPEMVIKNSKELPKSIKSFISMGEKERNIFKKQIINISDLFSSEEENIVAKWEVLLNSHNKVKINGLLNREIILISIKEFLKMRFYSIIDRFKRYMSKLKKRIL